MKKSQLLEWGIITIGVIFGYNFFEATFSMIVQFAAAVNAKIGDLGAILVPSLIATGLYFGLFIFLIRRSGQIANYLSKDSTDENVPIRIGKRSLLQVILIGICVATILSNFAHILLWVYDSFKHQVGRRSYTDDLDSYSGRNSIKINLVQTIISLVVLYFARDISNALVRKSEVDELTFDSNPEN